MEKWMVKNIKFDNEGFAREIGVSPVVAKLLVNRGIYNIDLAKEFLSSSIKDFHNPKEMFGMDGAVELMKDSIKNGEKILIVGDYDV